MIYKAQNELLGKLRRISGLKGFETKIKIRKNISILEASLKPVLEEKAVILSIVQEYNDKVDGIYKKYSKGKTIPESIEGKIVHKYDIKESDQELLFEEIEKLSELYKKDIDNFEKKSKEFNTYYTTKGEHIELMKINKSILESEDKDISEINLDYMYEIIDFEK